MRSVNRAPWMSRGSARVSDNEGTMLSPSDIAVYVCTITKGVRRCGTAVHV